MLGRLFFVGALVVLMATLTVRGAIPGPKDPRYPDNIVDPRVNCVSEGTFLHPRNCSWYYRCVDRMSVGFFWTYYFECEPGTIFSDELDQCVHPSSVTSGPCAGVTTTTTTTAATTTSQEPFLCTGVPGTCKTYDICRPKRTQKVMCGKIQCTTRTQGIQCAQGYLFDIILKECAKPPAEADLCGANDPPINITEVGDIPCSYEDLRPSSEFVSRLYCDTYVLCDGDNYKSLKELCRNYFECYKDGNEWKVFKRNCPNNLLYSYENDTCEPKPSEDEICKSNVI